MKDQYFVLPWRPLHPDIIRKRDSERIKKKKMKRWPPEEFRNKPYYVWFSVTDDGEECPIMSSPITYEEFLEKTN